LVFNALGGLDSYNVKISVYIIDFAEDNLAKGMNLGKIINKRFMIFAPIADKNSPCFRLCFTPNAPLISFPQSLSGNLMANAGCTKIPD
jgi:hypothetical protein